VNNNLKSGTPASLQDRITRRPYLKRYLRGDQSNYEIEDGAHYKFEINCGAGWLP
jgi:hypothetical protein